MVLLQPLWVAFSITGLMKSAQPYHGRWARQQGFVCPLPPASSLCHCQGGGGDYSTEGFYSTALSREPQLGLIAKAILHHCWEAQLLEMV